MTVWKIEREENVRFWMEIAEDCRVTLANGAGARVTGVSVQFTRKPGDPWSEPRVDVAHGKGWDLAITNVPGGLRGQRVPAWLRALVAECRP